MVFLTPLFLVGLMAALIPIAIHLIRKEKPPKLLFSSIRFLKKTSKKLILFQQIQQWLLLLLRSAVIALLVMAFARPLVDQSVARLLDADPKSVVILLDVSMSMRYGDSFDQAKQAVLDIIDDL
ncbi:MAG: VWA domain-containing protein, partial [Proteobacteria bacterium]|nr:VWA domain-containing protein [Pseudomonadota bacterium]